jgi:hypothetical protein
MSPRFRDGAHSRRRDAGASHLHAVANHPFCESFRSRNGDAEECTNVYMCVCVGHVRTNAGVRELVSVCVCVARRARMRVTMHA